MRLTYKNKDNFKTIVNGYSFYDGFHVGIDYGLPIERNAVYVLQNGKRVIYTGHIAFINDDFVLLFVSCDGVYSVVMPEAFLAKVKNAVPNIFYDNLENVK